MKPGNQPHWILKEIAEIGAPRGAIHLWSQIEAHLAAIRPERAPKTIFRGFTRGQFTMKKAFLYILVVLTFLLGAAVGLVPDVRAQVSEWVSGQTATFNFGNPGRKSTVALISDGPWGFVPLSPTYLPWGNWETVPDFYKDDVSGVETLKLTLNQGDQFVILTQRKALLGEPLPAGETIWVNDRPAVVATGLAGEAQAGIPLDQEHGGVLPEPNGQIRLYSIPYTKGVRLIWQVGEIRLEILSNLPQKQILKIAASLQPVETGPAEIITTEP